MSRSCFYLILILAFSFTLAAQEAKEPKPANTNYASTPAPAPAKAQSSPAQPAPPAPANAQASSPAAPAPPAPANSQAAPAQPAPPASGHNMHNMPGEPAPPGTESATPQPPLPPTTPVITLDYCSGAAANATGAKSSCKTVITKAEFDGILDAAIPKSRRPAGADIPPQVKQAVAREYLNMYIMAKEAERRGYDKKPMAQEMLDLSRKQVLSMVLNQELQEKTKPSDTEIEKYYNDNPSAYVEVGLRRLYIPKPAPVPPATPNPAPNAAGTTANNAAEATKPAEAPKPPDQEALKAAADKLHDRAAAGDDLDKLEKEAFEAAGSKQTPPPTQMGNRRRGILPPDQDAEVFALDAGQVSKLFDNPGGWYLYKVESKRTLPLSEVKDEIQRKLQPEKLNDARTAITGKVKSNFNEKYFGGPVAAATGAPAPGKAGTPAAGATKQPASTAKAATKTGAAKANSLTHKPQTANPAH